jgi:hypothetical protein
MKTRAGADVQALNTHLLQTIIRGLNDIAVLTNEGVIGSGIGAHVGTPSHHEADAGERQQTRLLVFTSTSNLG